MSNRVWSWHPSIVMYSHDGFGLGHLSRSIYLAQCIRNLRPKADILIVTSSPAAHRVHELEAFEYVKLPSVNKMGVERYHPHNLRTSFQSIIKMRSSLLLAVVKEMRPDVLLIDHRPLGLRKEALPTLRWLRECAPETHTVAGLRDVVDAPDVIRQQWRDQGVYDTLERYFDHILVYGDRTVLDPVEEYGLSPQLAAKVRFTGYLGRGAVRLSRERVREILGLREERLVVVHTGGGGDGSSLIGTYLNCIDALPDDVYTLVVTGPLMAGAELAGLSERADRPRLRLVDYQDDLRSYVAASDLTVCMGGYNSVAELLSVGVRALVVPRVHPRAEQYIRARLLESRGLLRALDPENLDARSLAQHVMAALAEPPRPAQPVQLDGGPRAAAFLTSLLPQEGWIRMKPADVEIGVPS